MRGTTTAKIALPGGHTLGSLSGLEVDAAAVRGGSGLTLEAKGFGCGVSARGGRLGDIAPLRERREAVVQEPCSRVASKSKKSGNLGATGTRFWREAFPTPKICQSYVTGFTGRIGFSFEKGVNLTNFFHESADQTVCQTRNYT